MREQAGLEIRGEIIESDERLAGPMVRIGSVVRAKEGSRRGYETCLRLQWRAKVASCLPWLNGLNQMNNVGWRADAVPGTGADVEV